MKLLARSLASANIANLVIPLVLKLCWAFVPSDLAFGIIFVSSRRTFCSCRGVGASWNARLLGLASVSSLKEVADAILAAIVGSQGNFGKGT